MDPRQLVVVLSLKVGEIGIVGEIGMLGKIGNLGEFKIHGKIKLVNDGSGLMFEMMEFTDDGVFRLEVDEELGICVFGIWFCGALNKLLIH
ncbi:hypothetical protein Tco_1298600 [Tanacetum coccineum]